MTNGSCHSTCESQVQPWEKPASSARCIIAITPLAGGLVCSTTPKSMIPPKKKDLYTERVGSCLQQVLIQSAGEERAVARMALVCAVVDDHAAAGQGGHHPAGDLHTLVGGVVHVHVVGGRGQRLPRLRVVDHDVRVGACR